MASMCRAAAAFSTVRTAAVSTVRKANFPSKTSIPKSIPSKRFAPLVSRPVYAALGSVGSMMPLHSAIASARLNSFIAQESSYWSRLSLGLMEDN